MTNHDPGSLESARKLWLWLRKILKEVHKNQWGVYLLKLNIPHATVHKILKVKLQEHANKIHVVQMLQEEDYHVTLNLCQDSRPKITISH